MSRVLVIGYGNPLRRDDGFGWHVAQELRNGKPHQDLEAIACHQLTPDLAEPLSRAEYVIFVDAMRHPSAGSLTVQKISDAPGATAKFTHHATPHDLMVNAQEWYGTCPRVAYIVSASANDFGFGETMSGTVSRLVSLAVKEIEWLCAATRDRSAPGSKRNKKIVVPL